MYRHGWLVIPILVGDNILHISMYIYIYIHIIHYIYIILFVGHTGLSNNSGGSTPGYDH
jgi:hypothetical protein